MGLHIPGKTYLVGEYAVLLGGAALGLATSPCFEVSYGQGISLKSQTHPESPAGLYLNRHYPNPSQDILAAVSNPYTGGFGKSTAEYWAAVLPNMVGNNQNFSDILQEYRALHTGSGIDLAIQYFGRVTEVVPNKAGSEPDFDAKPDADFKSHGWLFEGLDFSVIATGHKIATHEHLAQLDKSRLHPLPHLSAEVCKTYVNAKEEDFLRALQEWVLALKALNLTCPSSLEICEHLKANKDILIAKPCGALGADVILAFYPSEKKVAVSEYLQSHSYQVLADKSSLHDGVKSEILKKRDYILKGDASYVG
ncbi:hypothetical protein [Pseudobdellovibrio exovorus]|uniref:GHMP kinase N-terminal domain-containing protein n=1 Tax=Pseudobdellovibrio exovorus JSS TaxID=1184267 RepID=M4VB61_9BACT|nr:hypothetical protein [Pseudobdellovibrio exovorus]AGH95715.1 hypothetical protein A11Q_1499 [Pseudobdellovibrio exovorus JSS]